MFYAKRLSKVQIWKEKYGKKDVLALFHLLKKCAVSKIMKLWFTKLQIQPR